MAKVKLTESQLARLKDSVLKKEMEKSVPSESTPEVTKSIKLTESKLNELINKVIEKETLKKKDNLISEEQKQSWIASAWDGFDTITDEIFIEFVIGIVAKALGVNTSTLSYKIIERFISIMMGLHDMKIKGVWYTIKHSGDDNESCQVVSWALARAIAEAGLDGFFKIDEPEDGEGMLGQAMYYTLQASKKGVKKTLSRVLANTQPFKAASKQVCTAFTAIELSDFF